MTGWFTLDSGGWLTEPPARSDLTVSQLADLLRLSIEGEPIPERYAHLSAFDLLADLHLVASNEIRSARSRRDLVERDSQESRAAVARVWRIVRSTGKRKTLRTDDVKDALTLASHARVL